MTLSGPSTPNSAIPLELAGILPASSNLIAAFSDPEPDGNRHEIVLLSASMLAAHHQQQWDAEEISRREGSSPEAIAASKQLIDALNAHRVELVDHIDAWVEQKITCDEEGSLHTETLGALVDRLAIAWVRANNVDRRGSNPERAHLARRQLAELAEAYDDLIADMSAGARRLPRWRTLKNYKSQS